MARRTFVEKLTISEPEIVPPHDFSFQYNYYVISPERQEDDALVEVIKLKDGKIVKVELRSIGTVEHPCLELTVKTLTKVTDQEISEIKEQISWRLCLTDDLKSFYKICKGDSVMQTAISTNYGAKDKAHLSVFEAVIDCVCSQNVIFKRLYEMMNNLCRRFGDKIQRQS